jgi:serine protease Do
MHVRKLPAAIGVLLLSLTVLQAKPAPKETEEPKPKPAAFKPVSIDGELTQADPKDAKLDHPAKTYTLKLKKDKAYIIDLVSKDFDAFLRVLDKNGKELAEDDDSGGDLNARIFFTPDADDEYKIVTATLNGEVGKFTFKVREFQLTKTEAKPREVGKDGISIDTKIGANDASDLGKLGKTYSVQMKAGQTYTIELNSNDLDSYLYLFDAKGKKLAEDDDSGGDLNSRIVFRPERDGVYHIIATSLGGDETGDIALRVRKE